MLDSGKRLGVTDLYDRMHAVVFVSFYGWKVDYNGSTSNSEAKLLSEPHAVG